MKRCACSLVVKHLTFNQDTVGSSPIKHTIMRYVCNGSTSDFDSESTGSSPVTAAKCKLCSSIDNFSFYVMTNWKDSLAARKDEQ